MLPTLNISGDVLLSEHVSHRFGKVGAGDLVLVRSPNDPRKIVTKRILGMEGDQVTFFVDPKHSDRSRTTVVCVIFCCCWYVICDCKLLFCG